MKKKILVLLTGGTIGSEASTGTIELRREGSHIVALYLKGEHRQEVDFDVVSIENIASENATLHDLTAIVNTLAGVDTSFYSGVIVCYGTDTLAYASNLTAMALPAYPIPVVFVSSDKPLNEAGANGLVNFSCAVDFICGTGLNGVYVSYQNPNEQARIHFGSRLLQSELLTDRFRSAADLFFGTMENGAFVYHEVCGNPSLQEIQEKKNGDAVRALTGEPPAILYIKPCPGADFTIYHIESRKPTVAVVELYHSGTGPAEGKTSLAEFITRCRSQSIPVVLASYPYQDGRRYTTTKTLLEKGGIFAYRMSTEAAYAKTALYFMSKSNQSLVDYLDKELFFEILN